MLDHTRLFQPAQVMEPPWMTTARHMIGQREVPGLPTAPFITAMLNSLGAWWRDDETAWCATFVSHCLHDAGMPYAKAFYRARAYESYGRTWADGPNWPAYGAIAVLDRPPSKTNGHVAFYVGTQQVSDGHTSVYKVLLLGGNQDNQVCVRAYPVARVQAWRWPTDYPVPNFTPAPEMLARLIHNIPPVRSDA